MKKLLTITLLLLGGATFTVVAKPVTSPNGKIKVVTKEHALIVNYQGKEALKMDITGEGKTLNWTFSKAIKDDYRMLTGKRLHCTNEANEYLSDGMVLRVYNDGIALRDADITYYIPEGTKRWMQQWTDSYEGFFPLATTYKVEPVPSYSGISKSAEGWNNRWGYPALIEPQKGIFVLLSEANIERGQSASCLMNDGEHYRVVSAERIAGKTSDHTPWRIAIIGALKDVVESTLVTDVSEACKLSDVSWIQPGVVSWIYWAYNHGSNDYNIIKQYVDQVVLPTYNQLAVLNDALDAAVKQFKQNPSNANFTACANAWLEARQPWEQSEAFLFGPVDELGLDPNMDSWPLDQAQIAQILKSQAFNNLNWKEGESDEKVEKAQSLRGFHTLEFLIFKDGKARTVN